MPGPQELLQSSPRVLGQVSVLESGSCCQVSVLQGLGHCCRPREGNTCWGLEG